MTGGMMMVLAMCGAHFVVGSPKLQNFKEVMKSLGIWSTAYLIIFIAQAFLYEGVVLKWLA